MSHRLLTLRVLILGGLILISSSVFGGGQPEIVDTNVLEGEVVYTEGSAELNSVQANLGDVVRPGDVVSTGSDGAIEITFGSKNILRFQSDTYATIDPSWGGVNLRQGSIAAVLNGLARLGFGGNKRFQVYTDTAVMAVRGTSFFVDHRDVDEAYFCTCNGKLHIETIDGRLPEDTEAYRHDAIWYVRTIDGIRSFPSGLHYHDDDTLNSIAEKAGTRVFWKD